MNNRKRVDISELYDLFVQRRGCYFVCCDIDHLIPINEISNKAGDLAILESLRRMEAVAGAEDVIFRIGGDGDAFRRDGINELITIVDGCAYSTGICFICAVFEDGLHFHGPAVFGPFFENGFGKDAVVRDMELIFYVKADVTIDACAFIPPALSLQALDINGEDVRSAVEICTIGDIEKRFRVSAEGALH